MSDADLRTLARAAEASGSVVDLERHYAARVRAGELRDVRAFLDEDVTDPDERRLVGEAMSGALATDNGLAWRLLSWSPQIRTTGGGFRQIATTGHRRYVLAVVLRHGSRVFTEARAGFDDWAFWRGEDLVVIGVASAPGVPEGRRHDQPPHVAWPALGASPGNCVWTYARHRVGEPSSPQVLRCRCWARLAAVMSKIAEDRVAVPLVYARALADRLTREGTLFA
jgi:hypothetical protein